MTKDELLLLRRAETPKTLRLIELYPDEKRDLRPSDKSRTALEMATVFLVEEWIAEDLCAGRPPGRYAERERPRTIPDAVAALRTAFDATTNLITTADLEMKVDFYGNDLPLGTALMIEMLDHIHHRGQFTIYSRLAGARVPQIYGPSADEPSW